jgi:hydroxysqualene dehydroxylase
MAQVAQSLAFSKQTVVIVGGGWSGLACALRLVQSGFQPILYEAAPEPGGRAKRAPLIDHLKQSIWRDNGQHLLLNGCHAIQSLCKEIGVALPKTDFHYTDGHRELNLKGRRGRLGLIVGLLNARGFSWRERQRLCQGLLKLQMRNWQSADQQTVEDWLFTSKQPANLIRDFWAPLALAILNTPLNQAAMTRFAPVLRDTLGRGCEALSILQPITELTTSIVAPMVKAITAGGGQLCCGQRVIAINRHSDSTSTIFRLRFHDGSQIEASQVILALPPWALSRIDLPFPLRGLPEHFGSQPIATVYLGFEAGLRLPAPLVQIAGPTPDDARIWAMDRAHCGEPGVIAVSLSAEGPWTKLDNDTLARRCVQSLLPLMSEETNRTPCLWHKVVTIHRATYATTCDAMIPPQALTPMPGLFLTGDWTHPEYPATLEAAVASGRITADRLINARR